MMRLSTIELFRDYLSFSAGHFTIFSATKRENLHGHNYQVHAYITTQVLENGLTFDYRDYKKRLYDLCKHLNETVLLPKNSPHMKIMDENDFWVCHFHNEKIPFNKRDVTILPITNVTLEELSNWMLQQLIADKEELAKNLIQNITIKISSHPGQMGSASWNNHEK